MLTPVRSQFITGGEYFFDNAPNTGQGNPFTFNPADSIHHNLSIPTTGLSPGFHHLFVRFRNSIGIWSHFEGRLFYVIEPKATLPSAPPITAGEWFIDNDPGVGKANAFSLNQADSIHKPLQINISGISEGFHHLFVRVKNTQGKWSHHEGRLFYRIPTLPVSPTAPSLIGGEWFIGTDPGLGKGTPISFTSADSIHQLIDIGSAGLSAGTYQLFIRVKDETGIWSHYEGREFVICSSVPPSPTVSGAKDYCEGSTIQLFASTIAGATSYNWVGPNGFSATTQNISIPNSKGYNTGEYSVVAIKGNTFCDRSNPSTYEVRVDSMPNLIVTNPPKACAPASVNITTTFIDKNKVSGKVEYFINAGLTTPLARPDSITTSGTYYLKKSGPFGICVSSASVKVEINQASTGTHKIVACDSYQWIDGMTYTTSNNTATYMLKNAAGCDSLVTLDLTINKKSTGIDFVTACEGYKWIDGKVYTSNNNTATHVLKNAAGCDSTVTLNLSIINLDVSVTQLNNQLTANQVNATYQWLDCNDNFNPINGANERSYTPTKDGLYAVKIETDNCTDTSDCYAVTTVGIREDRSDKISYHPNPTTGKFSVVLDQNYSELQVRITSVTGQLISVSTHNNTQQLNLNIDGASGVYFVSIYEHENHVAFIKVLKE